MLRLRRTRHPDVVAVENLEHFLREAQERNVIVLLAGLRPEFVRILDNVGLKSWFPADRIFPEEEQVYSATLRAVRYANELAKNEPKARPPVAESVSGELDVRDPVYYLV